MPREARLFTSSAGSVVRGYLKFRANIPPRWIKNARVRASGSSRRSPKVSVLSNVCGSTDQGRESRFGTRRGNCARSWIAGRQPTERRTFIGGYESYWNCSAMVPPHFNANRNSTLRLVGLLSPASRWDN